jgi:hypothetical protein
MDITRDVMRGVAAGRSAAAIREEIDRTYAGAGRPTPTPRP